jgi:hypothetical protein
LEAGEIILHRSPLPENLPWPSDLFGLQMGAPGWMPIGCPACYCNSALCWCSVLLGMRACVTGSSMTYLPGALQVPLSSPIAGAIVHVAVGSSSLDGGGAEPPSKRARPWSFLPASTRYVCGAEFCGMPFPLLAFWILGFEGSVVLNDRSHTLLVSVVRRQPAVSVA